MWPFISFANNVLVPSKYHPLNYSSQRTEKQHHQCILVVQAFELKFKLVENNNFTQDIIKIWLICPRASPLSLYLAAFLCGRDDCEI